MMVEILLIVLIVLAVLLLGMLIFLFVIIKKKNQNVSSFPIDELKNALEEKTRIFVNNSAETNLRIEQVEARINERIDNTLKTKMLEVDNNIQSTLLKQSQSSQETLLKFQSQLSNNVNQQIGTMKETLQKDVQALTEKVNASLERVNQHVNESLIKGFDSTSKTMNELQERLGKVQEAQRQMEHLGGQVTNLNNILSNNQKRGRYGEYQLESLMRSLLGDFEGVLYEFQKTIGNDEEVRPDASLIMPKGDENVRLCIDSKFPYQNYERIFDETLTEEEKKTLLTNFKSDVKNRMKEIKEKYVGRNGTADQAIMFIPNDGLFAFIQSEYRDLVEDAYRNGVLITSPSTLMALLVLFHNNFLERKRDENILIIGKLLKDLGTDFRRFNERWKGISSSFNALSHKVDNFDTTVRKIDRKFEKIQNVEGISSEEDETMSLDEIEVQDD